MSAALYRVLRRPLFTIDPEHAHRAAITASSLAEMVLGLAPRARVVDRWPRSRQRLVGLDFPNPIGLAAGFDKDGVAPHLWAALGFGFAEIGTVTAKPQPGNPTPRLFRLEQDRALVNRLGFNSAGAEAVAARLGRRLGRRPAIPIGLNVGCSRASIGDAATEIEDYRRSVGALAPLADYLAVNVSSPNTPGLRDLQAPERLSRLLGAVRETLGETGRGALPVLVKLAPDLADATVAEVAQAALAAGAAGFIAGNTTLSRAGCSSPNATESGGLSGAPLRVRATELVALVRAAAGPEPLVIGVGGVLRLEDVLEKIDAGADLVALYTGLVYEGPRLPARLADDLERHLAERGELLRERRRSPASGEPPAREGA